MSVRNGFRIKLGECRTLWNEREQAKHRGIELLDLCKALPVKYEWHIAKTKFVTINSIVMLGEKSQKIYMKNPNSTH